MSKHLEQAQNILDRFDRLTAGSTVIQKTHHDLLRSSEVHAQLAMAEALETIARRLTALRGGGPG